MADNNFGTDYKWNSSVNNLETVTANDNLKQSVKNRILTRYDELGWVYDDYGCNFRDYLGGKADEETLKFIENSIVESLGNDDRVNDFDVNVTYVGDGVIQILVYVDGVLVEVDSV